MAELLPLSFAAASSGWDCWRELIQKIENNPDLHALQRDLQQNQAYNPFSPESKKMIQEVGNIELFELFETDT